MRRDLISLTLGEYRRTLTEIAELKKQVEWAGIINIVGVSLRCLLRTTPQELSKLTETGLLAQLVKQGSTFWVPYKKMMLVALLKETGDYAMKKDRPRAACGWYLKALHFLLDSLAHDEIHEEFSDVVPSVEVLLSALGEFPLPVRTRLLLMREYERRGCFGRVRDEFNAALEKSPNNSKLLEFGIAFFERLSHESDATLASCGVPRAEIDAILRVASAKVRNSPSGSR